MIEWKDTSTYSKSDTKREIAVMSARVAGVRISVHRHIHYDPKDWLLTCAPWFDNKVIGQGTLDEACQKAIEMVKGKVAVLLEQIS